MKKTYKTRIICKEFEGNSWYVPQVRIPLNFSNLMSVPVDRFWEFVKNGELWVNLSTKFKNEPLNLNILPDSFLVDYERAKSVLIQAMDLLLLPKREANEKKSSANIKALRTDNFKYATWILIEEIDYEV